jgi:hypothetical protein
MQPKQTLARVAMFKDELPPVLNIRIEELLANALFGD